MKRIYLVSLLLCCPMWIFTGCGKKGDPAIPVVPQPRPIAEISARVEDDGVILSWIPPTAYDTDKTLTLDDIRTFTVFRKTETPVANRWDFSQTTEGWESAGKTLPVKRHKGTLRTISDQSLLILRSPEDLGISAQSNRYIRLKLWAQNSQQGYITFITSQDTTWDKDVDLIYEPAVHTSYYNVQKLFSTIKSKPFPLITSPSNVAHEYVLDMQRIPSWDGTINQIGILLRNSEFKESMLEESESASEESQSSSELELEGAEGPVVEIGLESIELLPSIDEKVSLYEAPPWMFLDEQEGWKAFRPGRIFGASDGVLYAQGNDPIALLSKPGQAIQVHETPFIQIRMNITNGEEAYLVLRRGREESFHSFESISTIDESYTVIPIPLQEHGSFHTYAINLGEHIDLSSITEDVEGEEDEKDAVSTEDLQEPSIVPETRPSQGAAPFDENSPLTQTEDTGTEPEEPGRTPGRHEITQIGLVLPSLNSETTRHIGIDYIDVAAEPEELGYRASRLTQLNIPPITVVEQYIRTQLLEKMPEFDMPYDEIPEEKERTPVTRIQLVEISPKDPAPAKIVKISPQEPVSTEIEDTSPKDPVPLETEDTSLRELVPEEIEREQFVLVDKGDFIIEGEEEEEEERVATLEYGNRYSYNIEITDRKKRKSELSEVITVDFVRVPSPPDNFRAEPGDEEITLTWDRPLFTRDGKKIQALAGYRIFRSSIPGDYPATPITSISSGQTTFIDKNLSNREKYYYTIQSIASITSDIGGEEVSEEISAIPIDTTPPVPPTGVVGIYMKDTVNLHWSQVQSGDFAGFNVYRSNTPTGMFQQNNSEPILKASYEDSTVEAKKRYYYRVTSFDDEIPPNESEPSDTTPVETFPLD